MSWLTMLFLAIALFAAAIGFGWMGDFAWAGAKTIFYIFLVLAGLSFVHGTGFFGKGD